MKHHIARLLLSPEYQSSLLGLTTRHFIRFSNRFYKYSLNFLLDSQAIDRPHYVYCMLGAARLAQNLGHDRISAIEFGVAGGNGLKFMCDVAGRIRDLTGVTVECYGFDTGEGMPPPEGARDLPYWFASGQYRMDQDKLRREVPDAHLVIGNIRDTIQDFIATHNPPPIGAIMNDTDYWSSTRECLSIFDQSVEHHGNFLPRLFMYFDDIIGTEHEMYGPCNGQLLAIDEFNATHETMKVYLNQNLLGRYHLSYARMIYYAHLFEHSDYDKFIGQDPQSGIEGLLKLRS